MRELTPRSTLQNLKTEAKRWLKALRAQDPKARARLERVWPDAPPQPGMREVQYALAREFGLDGWKSLLEKLRGLAPAPAAGSEALQELFAAAETGDVARVRELLDRDPGLINQRGTLTGHSGERTALHFAMDSGGSYQAPPKEELVRLLLERGADPNIRDEGDNAFPLHFAAERQALPVIRLLIEYGADPIGRGDLHELEVIGWATCFGKPDPAVVEYLLAHGARHNVLSATAVGDLASLRAIGAREPAELDRRMDRTNQHRRPLHLAVVSKQPGSLATLLELGAEVERVDAAGLTPLDQAALNGEADMVRLLLAHGATIRLPAAVVLGRTEEIARLVREEPDCLKPGRSFGALIVRAAERGTGEVIEALLRHGADVNGRDNPSTSVDSTEGYTALHAAAFHGNLEAARVLLQHGADVRARDSKYVGTPAGWANYAKHYELRDFLLMGRIDPFEAIEFGLIARLPGILLSDPGALRRPFREYVRFELEQSARPEWTPLEFARFKGNDEAVRLLEEWGARDNEAPQDPSGLVDRFLQHAAPDWSMGGGPHQDRHRRTAERLLARHPELAEATFLTRVVSGDLEGVRRLLVEQPEEARRPGGPKHWPPLLYLCAGRLSLPAVRENAVAIARELLEHGADPDTYYPGGNETIHYTALTAVIGEGEEDAPPHVARNELAELLLERGAEPYDTQVFYNTHFRGDILWFLKLVHQHSVRLGREADWKDPEWGMVDMGAYGKGAGYFLTIAVTHNNLELADWLLRHGATPNAGHPRPGSRRPGPKRTLYQDAVGLGLLEMAALLARFGADTRPLELEGEAAFTEACLQLDQSRIQAMLRQHPEYLQSPGALTAAAKLDRPEVIRLLLDLGVSPNVRDRSGQTALHTAAYSGSLAAAKLLVERGAEIDPVDEQHGGTPLWFAMWGKQTRLIELLGRYSRDLWALSATGNLERIRHILREAPSLATRSGQSTPLFWLPDDEPKALEIAKLLLANGADPSFRRKQDGLTAGDLAAQRGMDDVAALLSPYQPHQQE